MKVIIIACILALAAARPDYSSKSRRDDDDDVAKILRDDRVSPDDGKYSFDIETEDGIVRSEAGDRLDIENNPTGQHGTFSFTFPNGEEFELKFVADENGFQPESDWLPVAPEFPHPIPQFVLDQIEKAAREDEEKERSEISKSKKSKSRSGYN